jgi:DNA-binding NtrC family response regulator/pSer/pThr/pTyr-binding forkhead associated (FHA) protein
MAPAGVAMLYAQAMEPSPPTGDVAQTATSSARPSEQADYLLVIEGERSWTVPLQSSGELVVGRGPDAGLRLSDDLVSRAHAQLLGVPDGIRISDLGSRHGTHVNGQPLTAPRLLASGDVISIGNALLIVHRPVRASGGRAVLDNAGLLRRFEEELERSQRFRREVSLVVVRAEHSFDRARVAAAFAPRLRLIDAMSFLSDREAAILLPEADIDEAGEVARALVAAVPGVTAGVATSPADGVDVDTLLSCARAAATLPDRGAVAFAHDAIHEVALDDHQLVLADPAMVRIYDLIKRLARSTLPILVQGETGVGKELAAAAVHAFSSRASGPFVSINCAAIPEQLAESELFGHERGAFTGAVAAKQGQLEAASGGTVFLDELGELPLAVQAKLLRVLETGELQRVGDTKPREVDIRIVAATNRDLAAEVEAGRFRRDLFFRLGAAQVVVPPLRDRPRDLAILAKRLFNAACARLGRRPLEMTVAATQALFQHRWPGNVRELKNTMDYAAAAAPDTAVALDVWHLPPVLTTAIAGTRDASAAEGDASITPDAPLGTPPEPVRPEAAAMKRRDGAETFRPIEDEVRELERKRMIEALAATGGVQNKAAELIQMPLRTFVTKLKRYAIMPSDWKT